MFNEKKSRGQEKVACVTKGHGERDACAWPPFCSPPAAECSWDALGRGGPDCRGLSPVQCPGLDRPKVNCGQTKRASSNRVRVAFSVASLTLGRWYASLESVCVILKGKGRVEGVAAQRLRARCLPHGWQCNLYPPVAVIVVVVIIAEKALFDRQAHRILATRCRTAMG